MVQRTKILKDVLDSFLVDLTLLYREEEALRYILGCEKEVFNRSLKRKY